MKTNKTTLAVAGFLAAFSMTPAQAADDVTLRLDWVLGGYHAVWHYAKEKGVFAKHGINISLREGRGSMTTSQTVGNQSDEFGTADGGAMMVLRSKGLKVKMVAGYLRTGPSALIFPKSKGWKSWKDVKGAKIADSAGGSTIFLFKAVEKAMGLSGNKIVLVAPPAKVSSVLSGKVDGTNSFGFLQKPIMESKGTPAAYLSFASAGVNVPGLAVIAHEDLIKNKADLVRRMVASTQEALKIVQENPEAAIDALRKIKSTLNRSVHLAILKSSFDLYHSAASKGKPLGWIPPADIEKAQNLLVEYEQIKTKVAATDYYTNAFIR
ncbi:MAG: ABC transporter substrate-binding protein [Alphaproteobacteria bacterium]|jgi:NitT/TauT family transport system substrate-binding protein|nr:ABC transporter substrate-binding protein [Alphaproteobacteria bacterium]